MSWDVRATLEENCRQGIAEIADEAPEIVRAVKFAAVLYEAAVSAA